MPRKETAAQRKTRIGLLVAQFDAENRELAKKAAIVKGLKTQLKDEVPPEAVGTYGDFIISYAAPKEIVDQQAVKQLMAQHKIEIPTKLTEPALVVNPKLV